MRHIVALLGFTCLLYSGSSENSVNVWCFIELINCNSYFIILLDFLLVVQCSHNQLSSSNSWPFNKDDDVNSRQSNGNSWSFPTDSEQQESVNTQFECGLANIYRSSIPTGRTKMSNIETTELEKPEECIQACCDIGPEKCQYAWMFAKKCFLIGCDEEEKNLCEPMQFHKAAIESTYYKVQLVITGMQVIFLIMLLQSALSLFMCGCLK